MAPPRGKKKQADPEEEDDDDDEQSPELSPVDSGEEQDDSSDESSVYDSEDGLQHDDESSDDESDDDDDDDDDNFEDQGSSDDEEDRLERQRLEEESDDDDIAISYEKEPRSWNIAVVQKSKSGKRRASGQEKTTASTSDAVTASKATPDDAAAKLMHTDDWSSDDDDDEGGTGNRIGRVPIHWYDDYEHIGYDVHGDKVAKSASSADGAGDRIDQALAMQENRRKGKFVVHDALNDTNVELTARQVELIRRMQASAVAHPEHEANPDYVDYFSGVDPELSGLNSNTYEPKARFQPSRWEKLQVDRLLDRLAKGSINMDYLTGKIKDMNEAHKKGQQEDSDKPFLLWTGDEEDELNMRKGPQHIAAPKRPPPGHAESYNPPDEYLPTEEEKKQWAEIQDPKDRPHGLVVPKKYPNLRSVGAYPHSVRETFERCLDLYLCPRVLKRRLNIDPESLVPRLPRANDLRPFPTAKCMEYKTPYDESSEDACPPVVRCVTASPNGQFMASGASDGFVRLWEVETGRLLQSWNLSNIATELDLEEEQAPASEEAEQEEGADTTTPSSATVKPVVKLEWNPNRSHHCLLAAVGKCVVVIATGTAGENDAEITETLLSSAVQGGNVTNPAAAKAVSWKALQKESSPSTSAISSQSQGPVGPICALLTSREVADIRWQAKGDYFVSVSPKAQASAVLIHQLSRGNSQRPFSKAKGEAQLACFHPNKPFLFVASQQHVRIYHLVKQSMVKRLITGCRWISSLDVHPSTGDHLIVGSLDRRAIWFDLDLSSSPYKTLKYHERALRSCRYHGRYPLMATASDDGVVHVFHSMVYSDLMRNPLIVPVKILRGHAVTKKKLGVLALTFHPTQPWLFTAGADGRIFLYQDI